MNTLILPILAPLLTAIAAALLNGCRRVEKAICLLSCVGLTAFVCWLLVVVDRDGIQVSAIGGYAPPWGVVLVADRLACIMLCLSMVVGTAALTYSFWTVTELQQRYFFYPLFMVMLAGVNWSFLTGDLFNLFVAYEVMLIGSYGAMMVGAEKAQVRETLKYLAINIIGGAAFVAGLGLIYATVGTLNMADVSRRTALLTGERAWLVTTASMILLVVFALKAAVFPLFFWLPGSYPVVPAGVQGYFAGLLTKVGVYSLLRVFIMVFRQEGHEQATQVLLAMSGVTMLLGVLGAVCQWEIQRILSWHSVSQTGYMVMGIGLAGDLRIANLAIAGTVVFVAHHSVVKSCLFLVGGVAERVTGSQEIKKMGGVLESSPMTAGLFLVAAMSLAGAPPTSGFIGKFVLFRAGLDGGHSLIVLVAVVTGFLTLYSMVKVWLYAFWGESKKAERLPVAAASYRGMMVPTGVLAALTIALGLWAGPAIKLAENTAGDLLNPKRYIDCVLGRKMVSGQPVGQNGFAALDAGNRE